MKYLQILIFLFGNSHCCNFVINYYFTILNLGPAFSHIASAEITFQQLQHTYSQLDQYNRNLTKSN